MAISESLPEVRESTTKSLTVEGNRFDILYNKAFIEECTLRRYNPNGGYSDLINDAKNVLKALKSAIHNIHLQKQQGSVSMQQGEKYRYEVQGWGLLEATGLSTVRFFKVKELRYMGEHDQVLTFYYNATTRTVQNIEVWTEYTRFLKDSWEMFKFARGSRTLYEA
ncbi:hypothetical protein SCHPADRAFT_941676 [Schizopora paradoxa]|uniref:Uncharacterized protein n=1 Tax=Schizopora paradoxa TaxID=27342 RepID=A0A0H2RR82_9AGAM|nr:hypothetical protein SCHPADRAFT_941676 [Schizopora paradoxa]